jgi:hypothetical protein
LRAKWAGRLGAEGIRTADEFFQTTSMSGTAELCWTPKTDRLDSLIAILSDYPTARLRIEAAISTGDGDRGDYLRRELSPLDQRHELFRRYLKALRNAGFQEEWNSERLRASPEQIPAAPISAAVARLLGYPSKPAFGVFLLHYCKPIAFQLPNGFMASEPIAPGGAGALLGSIPLLDKLISGGVRLRQAKRFPAISVHESLHGFRGSPKAVPLLERVLTSGPELGREYSDLIHKWSSGPEEYFVVAGEVYLSETPASETTMSASATWLRRNGG